MRRRWLVLAGTLGLAGCLSPDPAFYTLRVVPGTPIAAPAENVQILTPGLAGYLDRPEIIRDSAVNRLKIDSGERWAEPLGGMVARVLGEDLAQRLPGSSVFTTASAIIVRPTVRLSIDVQRCDLDADGTVVLQMQVAAARGHRTDAAVARPIRIAIRPATTGTADVVSALSQALGQVADRTALTVSTLPPALNAN